MLKPSEFLVGYAAEAQPLSLILPRGKYEHPLLIARRGGETMAVFIGEQHKFHAIPCADSTRLKGLIIPDVTVELDHNSVFDPSENDWSAGCLLRCDTKLMLVAIKQERYSGGIYDLLTIADGLSNCAGGLQVGFRNWSVVLGAGLEKRTLLEFTPQTE